MAAELPPFWCIFTLNFLLQLKVSLSLVIRVILILLSGSYNRTEKGFKIKRKVTPKIVAVQLPNFWCKLTPKIVAAEMSHVTV